MAGKPVLATDVGEIRSMLTTADGKIAGDLVSLTDCEEIPVETLAQKVARFAENRRFYEEARARVTERAKEFDLEKIADNYSSVYTQVLSKLHFGAAQCLTRGAFG